MGGYFFVHRDFEQNPIFQRGPFCEPMAWVWLLGKAVYATTRVRVGRIVVPLERGQLAASSRFLADVWGWKEPRVRRFLNRLKIDAMIDADSDAGINVITICNYDRYQAEGRASDAPSDAPDDAEATQKRRRSDANNKNIKTTKTLSVVSDGLPDEKPKRSRQAGKASEHPRFPDFWPHYPKRDMPVARAVAAERFSKAIKGGADPDEIIRGVKAYAAHCEREGKLGTSYVLGVRRFFDEETWNGFQAAHAEPSRHSAAFYAAFTEWKNSGENGAPPRPQDFNEQGKSAA